MSYLASKTNTSKRRTTKKTTTKKTQPNNTKTTQSNHTKTTKRRPRETTHLPVKEKRFGDTILDEVILLGIIVISAVATLSQMTEHMGVIGNIFRSLLQGLLGFGGLLLPLCVIAYCIWMLVSQERKWMVVRGCGSFLFILVLSAGAYLFHPLSQQSGLSWLQKCASFYKDGALSNGGLLGGLLGDGLLRMFDALGSIVILLALLIISIVMVTGKSFFGTVGGFAEQQKTRYQERKERLQQEMEQMYDDEPYEYEDAYENEYENEYEDDYDYEYEYDREPIQKEEPKPAVQAVSQERELRYRHRRKPTKEGFNIELEEAGYAQERPLVKETVFQNKRTSITVKKREPIYDYVKDSAYKNHEESDKKETTNKALDNENHIIQGTHTTETNIEPSIQPNMQPSPIPPVQEAASLAATQMQAQYDTENGMDTIDAIDAIDTIDTAEQDIPIFASTIEHTTSAPSLEIEPISEPIPESMPNEQTIHTIQPEPKPAQKSEQAGIEESEILEIDEEIEEEQVEIEEKPYEFPPLSLLGQDPGANNSGNKAEMIETAKKLENTLKSFGVDAKVVQINKGPTVTRYEVSPSQGVKVSKIVNLADDIALNLAASGIRIEAPIPGKAAVGIEVPNRQTDSVYLRTVLESEAFQNHASKLAFALGVDIAGNPVVTDIAKMPHLLIAGATGSGKSVCINTLITSILYKATPKEVKLLLVDPKVVELSVYNGIPHLLIPVVTDPKKASAALNWAVREMLQRYNSFAACGVRDMKGFNKQKEEQGEPEAKMSQIVIIIDELADLMMAASGEVEDAICRLAQMARAAGMHLIIATQRPSVDVITGVIKANIPSRMAFAVSSGIDSRTILDTVGAEKLLGKGDMLFYPSGQSKPARMQGAFVTDEEVESIVDFLRKNAKPTYTEEMVAEITTTAQTGGIDVEVDEFFEQAVELIIEKKKASVSMLQRQFRIGYNRAARLMEDLEKRGMVGPEDGSKPRKVLITAAQWDELRDVTTDTDEEEIED